MTQTRIRRRQTPPDVVAAIQEKVYEGWSATQIDDWGQQQDRFEGRWPRAVRTVQYIVSDLAPRDSSGPWSLADPGASDPELVLPVLAVVIETTQGRVAGLTKGEAEWITRLLQAAPDLPPWRTFTLARTYIGRVRAGQETASLDAYLAFGSWREAGPQRYVDAFMSGAIDIYSFDEHNVAAFDAAMAKRTKR